MLGDCSGSPTPSAALASSRCAARDHRSSNTGRSGSEAGSWAARPPRRAGGGRLLAGTPLPTGKLEPGPLPGTLVQRAIDPAVISIYRCKGTSGGLCLGCRRQWKAHVSRHAGPSCSSHNPQAVGHHRNIGHYSATAALKQVGDGWRGSLRSVAGHAHGKNVRRHRWHASWEMRRRGQHVSCGRQLHVSCCMQLHVS